MFGSFTVYAETNSGDDNNEVAVDPTGKGDGYAAVLYNNTNGLPTSEANALAETSEGFIWIGSYSGLIRYDGNTFERIDSTTGIASVVSLYVDQWIGYGLVQMIMVSLLWKMASLQFSLKRMALVLNL